MKRIHFSCLLCNFIHFSSELTVFEGRQMETLARTDLSCLCLYLAGDCKQLILNFLCRPSRGSITTSLGRTSCGSGARSTRGTGRRSSSGSGVTTRRARSSAGSSRTRTTPRTRLCFGEGGVDGRHKRYCFIYKQGHVTRNIQNLM